MSYLQDKTFYNQSMVVLNEWELNSNGNQGLEVRYRVVYLIGRDSNLTIIFSDVRQMIFTYLKY